MCGLRVYIHVRGLRFEKTYNEFHLYFFVYLTKVEKELDPNEVLTAGVLTLPFTGVTTLRLKIAKLLVQFLEGVQLWGSQGAQNKKQYKSKKEK